jgi:hypothetical protein
MNSNQLTIFLLVYQQEGLKLMLNDHNTSKFWEKTKEYNKNKFLARYLLWLQFFSTKEQILFWRFLMINRFKKKMAYKLFKKFIIRKKRRRLKKTIELQRSFAKQQSSLLSQYQHKRNNMPHYDMLSARYSSTQGFMKIDCEHIIQAHLNQMHYNG